MVEGDDQLVIIEVDPIDEGINQPLAVGLLAHIQHPELVQIEQDLFFRQFWLGELFIGNFDLEFLFRHFQFLQTALGGLREDSLLDGVQKIVDAPLGFLELFRQKW